MNPTTLLVCMTVAFLLHGVDARPNRKIHRLPTVHHPMASMGRPTSILSHIAMPRMFSADNNVVASLPVLNEQFHMGVEIEVGTPAQKILVVGMLEVLDEFWLLNADAVKNANNSQAVCDEGSSSSFKNESQSYNGIWGLAKGYLASDIVNLGSVQPNLQFGVVNSLDERLSDIPPHIGGMLALSLNKTSALSPLHQILDGVDAKVLTVYQSALKDNYGSGLLTFGDEDHQNCPSPYVYADQLDKQWTFKAASLTSSNSYTVNINNVSVSDWSYGVVTTKQEVVDFFVNATGATPNDWHLPSLDCDQIANLPVINLNLDGTQSVALKPNDYTLVVKDQCYLLVYKFYYFLSDVTLGRQFFQTRCLSANLEQQQIGIGQAN